MTFCIVRRSRVSDPLHVLWSSSTLESQIHHNIHRHGCILWNHFHHALFTNTICSPKFIPTTPAVLHKTGSYCRPIMVIQSIRTHIDNIEHKQLRCLCCPSLYPGQFVERRQLEGGNHRSHISCDHIPQGFPSVVRCPCDSKSLSDLGQCHSMNIR